MYTLASPICVVEVGGINAVVLLLSYSPTVKVVAAPICGVPFTLFNLNLVPNSKGTWEFSIFKTSLGFSTSIISPSLSIS